MRSIRCFLLFSLLGSVLNLWGQVPGNALTFDGVNDHVALGNPASMNFSGTSDFTVEAWVNPATDHEGVIFDKTPNTGTGGELAIWFELRDQGRVSFHVGKEGTGWDWNHASVNYKPGVWMHVAGVKEGNQTKVYVNGKLRSTATVVNAPTATASAVIAHIGNMRRTGGLFHLNGMVDELRVWNVARTVSELQDNMFYTVSGASANLVGYYRFEDVGTTTLTDYSTNATNGTLTNMNASNDWGASYAMVKPQYLYAQSPTASSFYCSWYSSDHGDAPTTYYLDVDDDMDFSSPVAGYDNLDIGSASPYKITGLTADARYYYRIRAYKDSITGSSMSSDIDSALTSKNPPGSAYVFNGTDVYAEIGPMMPYQNNYSILAWIKTSADGTVYCWGDNQPSTHAAVQVDEGVLSFSIGKFSLDSIEGNTLVNDDKWHFIAVVKDSNDVALYVDGKLDATGYTTMLPSASVNTIGSGYLDAGGNQDYFLGAIDELSVWGVPLTAAAIARAMDTVIDPASVGLMAYYQFDNAGMTLIDASPNTQNGIIFGAADSAWKSSYALVVPRMNAPGNVSSSAITLNWSAPAYGTVDNYYIEVATDDSFTQKLAGFDPYKDASTNMQETVSGLDEGTTYYARVRAYNSQFGDVAVTSPVVHCTTLVETPGRALTFDGIDDYVALGNPASMNFSGASDFTVEAWVNPATDHEGVIFDKTPNIGASGELAIWFEVRDLGRVSFNIGKESVGWDWHHASVDYKPGMWMHVAGVKEGNQTKVYVNGVLRSTTTLVHAPTASASEVIAHIGNMRRSGGLHHLNGKVDELRVWNVARTASELQGNMYDTIYRATDNLVSYYRFDESAADTLPDYSANENHGVLTNKDPNTDWVSSYAMVKVPSTASDSVTSSAFLLSWNAPTLGKAPAGYRIQVDDDSDFASPLAGYDLLDVGNNLSHYITGLDYSTLYHYRVAAYRDSLTGISVFSTVDSVLTAAAFDVTGTTYATQCFASADGAIGLSIAGGTAPFTYLWSNASTLDSVAGLVAGAYTVTVTDSTGLVNISSYTIIAPSLLTADAGSDISMFAHEGSAVLAGISSTSTGIWTASGTGSFTPDAVTLDASYELTPQDVLNGTVQLTFTSTNPDGCPDVSDSVLVTVGTKTLSLAGFDNFMMPVTGEWMLDVTDVDAGLVNTYTSSNLPGNMVLTDTSLQMTQLPTGQYSFDITALDHSNRAIGSGSFSLHVPVIEIAGLVNKMYQDVVYSLDVVSGSTIQDVSWDVEGNQTAGSHLNIQEAASGSKSVIITAGCEGKTFQQSFALSILPKPNLVIALPTDSIFEDINYTYQLTNNFVVANGFSPDSIVWFVGGTRKQTGNSAGLKFENAGYVSLDVRAYYKEMMFSKVISVHVLTKPTVSIAPLVGVAGDSVSLPFTINNAPAGISLSASVYNTDLNIQVSNDRLVGVLGKYDGQVPRMVLRTPAGTTVSSTNLVVSVVPDINFNYPKIMEVNRAHNFYGVSSMASNVASWQWKVVGAGDSSFYYTANPRISFSTATDYHVTLKIITREGYSNQITKGPISINQNPNLVIGSNMPDSIEAGFTANIVYTVAGSGALPVFEGINLPIGASIDPMGVFTWEPKSEGIYNYSIKVTAIRNDGSGIFRDSSTVLQSVKVVDNSVFIIQSLLNVNDTTPLINAGIKIYEKQKNDNSEPVDHLVYDLRTDSSGWVMRIEDQKINYTFRFIKDKSYKFVVSYKDWPDVIINKVFTETAPLPLFYSPTVLEVADLRFEGSDLRRIPGTHNYQLTNAVVNHTLLIGDTCTIKNVHQTNPTLETTGRIEVLAPNQVLCEPSARKFMMGLGMIVSDEEKKYLEAGSLGSIDMYGVGLLFSSDTMELISFARLPWVMGAFMESQAESTRKNMLKIVKGEVDVDFSNLLSIYGAKSSADNLKKINNGDPLISGNGIVAKIKRKTNKARKFYKGLTNAFGIPEIEIVKVYHTQQDFWDFSIQDVTIASPSGVGLKDLDVIYKESESSFECNAELNWEQDREYGAMRDGSASVEEDLAAALKEIHQQLGNDPSMADVPVEVIDADGSTLYHTTYDEMTDITSEIILNAKRRKLPITGFRVEFRIVDGVIDKILLSVNTTIPVGAFIMSKITGSVDSLSQTINGVTTYRSEGFNVRLNCDLTDPGRIGLYEITGLGLHIKPWSLFEGSGSLNLFSIPVGHASIRYETPLSLFKTDVRVNLLSILRGRLIIVIGGEEDFHLQGYANVNVTTPDYSVIPKPFQNTNIGLLEAGIGNHIIAGKMTVGGQGESFKESRWSFSWVAAAVKAVTKTAVSVATTVKEVAVETVVVVASTVAEVVTVIVEAISFEIGVGYDFDKGEFLWGSDIEFPDIVRRASRGDTLMIDFDVAEDTRKLIVYADNGADSVVFSLLNPNNQFDPQATYVYFRKDKMSFAVVEMPSMGTWSVHVDTIKYPNTRVQTMILNNRPQGQFDSPATVDTAMTQIAVRFNDTNDTLKVQLFIDVDRQNYDGAKLTEFKVVNNASLKFDYAPENLVPGTYYFYYVLTDRTGAPVMQYAPGALVIPGGSLPSPMNVKQDFMGDSIYVYWDDPDSALVDHVTVNLVDVTTGRAVMMEDAENNHVYFSGISNSHTYNLTLFNVGGDSYSDPVRVLNIQPDNGASNKPPVWGGAPFATMEFTEGRLNTYMLNVVDPEGQPVTVSLLENMPKTMTVNQDSVFWAPQIGDKGRYTFHAVASDGVYSDTLALTMNVKPFFHEPIRIDFPSFNLYEADNLFVTVHDDENAGDEVSVMIYNLTKKDSIHITAPKVDRGKYLGYFQLSYQKRSILPVSDGDTIIAIYTKDTMSYATYSFFEETPQIADGVPPASITDLQAFDLNKDSLMVTFTVPYDQLDNGILTNPWVYDLRYNYQGMTTETAYFTGWKIESYLVGKAGEKDTLYIRKKDLYKMSSYNEIYFNLKTGDTRFNYSNLSNEVKVNYKVEASKVKAALNKLYEINVTWNGPLADTTDAAFVHYNVYRSSKSIGFEWIGSTGNRYFIDQPDKYVANGIIQYAVEAVYSDEVADAAYSNYLLFEKYANVSVFVRDSLGGMPLVEVSFDPFESSFAYRTNVTDSVGFMYFNKTINAEYLVTISKDGIIWMVDTVVVSPDESYFEYVVSLVDTGGIVTKVEELGRGLKLMVYPNPSSGELRVDLGKFSGQVNECEVISLLGMSVYKEIPARGASQLVLDLRHFENGEYVIQLKTADELISRTFILNK